MSETMNAFVMREIGKVAVMQKPIPEPGPSDAIVRTTAALICTSDTHTVAGAIGPRKDMTLGHEAVGVIHRLGNSVNGFREKERVLAGAITPCFQCTNCQRGWTSQCTQMLGGWKFANMKDGNMAEFFHVNNAAANLARIPDALSDEQAVYCADMLSTGFMAAEYANIPMGGSVAVFALGPIGLMAVAGARLCGAGLIIGIDGMQNRLGLARQYGCDKTINFKEHDAVKAILDMTGGEGVDSAIEAYGGPTTFQACIKVTRPGGTISNVGYHGEGDSVPIPRLAWGVGMSDKTIRTGLCLGGAERMRCLMRLIEHGRVNPLPLTTHRFKFSRIEEAFRMMQTKEDGMIKPLILFQ